MKKRKGFTLIELMIVIAIIIILAAIAIPNYLRMTDRARRARVAGDFSSTATALEAYSVDWGNYPLVDDLGAAAQQFGRLHTGTMIYYELVGDNANAAVNINTNTTLTGEQGGIEYIKAGTLSAMYNPFIPTGDDTVIDYWYAASPSGNHWILVVQCNDTDVLFKTDMTTDIVQFPGAALDAAITDLGVDPYTP